MAINDFTFGTNQRAGDSVFSAAANAAPVFKDAAKQVVDTNSTVEGRLNGLISSNSPYIQAARASAQRQANSRGLLNSSIAAGSGELAAIQSALPIAQQDAQSFFNAGQFNANNETTMNRDFNQFEQNKNIQARDAMFNSAAAENQFARQMDLQTGQQKFAGEQNALDRGQQITLQNDQQDFAGSQALADRVFQGGQNDAQRALQLNLQNIDANTRVQLANIEADYKQVLQSSSNAASIYSEFSKNIGAIQTNTSLNAETKGTLVKEQLNLLRNAFDIQGKLANLNLSALIPQP